MFDNLIEKLKAAPKRIVFTEGTDPRILEASARLLSGGKWLTPILVGNPDEVRAAAGKGGFDIGGAEIIDPANYPRMEEMVQKMVALRKGKMTEEQVRDLLKKGNYFGTMLVKMGEADALLGGATTPPPIPSVPPCSSSRPSPAPTWSPPASSSSATSATRTCAPSAWATAPSTWTIRTPWTRTAT